MFYLISRNFYPLLVLVSGLVSCAPDKDKKDDFRSSPPEIVYRAGSKLDLKTWDGIKDKSLDLQDAIRVSGGKVAQISSRCRKGDGDFGFTVSLTVPKEVHILQLLPREILGTNFRETAVYCAFDIVMKNEAGSRHIFNLNLATIKDEHGATAEIYRDGSPLDLNRERLTLPKLAGLKLRTQEPLRGEAAVYCEDARIPVFPFDVVTDFANANFAGAEVLPTRAANAIEARPLQLCRAAVLSDGLVQALTSPFHFQFPRAPLTVHPASLLFRQPAYNDGAYNQLSAGGPVTVGTHRLSNPSSARRWIRIKKGPRQADLNINYLLPLIITRPIVHLNHNSPTVKDLGDAWLIPIEPKSELPLSTVLRFHSRFPNCKGVMNGHRSPPFLVDFLAPDSFTEVNEDGVSLAEVRFDFGPRIYIMKSGFDLAGNPPMRLIAVCSGW